MEYKIKRITHSGTCGERGKDRTDDRYPLRIGRTVDLELDFVKPGLPLFLKYLKDSDGLDMPWKAIRTSHVVSVSTYDNIVRLETMNSIFEFEKGEN